jgi:hypothetical protein
MTGLSVAAICACLERSVWSDEQPAADLLDWAAVVCDYPGRVADPAAGARPTALVPRPGANWKRG